MSTALPGIRIHITPDNGAGPQTAPVLPQLWRHRTDLELDGKPRDCAFRLGGCPQVFTLYDHSMVITRQWQYYIRAINYGMDVRRVAMIFEYQRAFANGTGFGDASDPRRNYFTNEDLDGEELQVDKIRTCARSVLTGLESRDDLLVTMIDGNMPPKLKPGRIPPTDISRVDPDAYVEMPRTHPWLFYVANNIQADGDTVPFSDDGGVYEWTGDNRPRTFMPHVSKYTVWYSKSKLVKLRVGEGVSSPYAT